MEINFIKTGKRVQESRLGQGLSQERLAEGVNISVTHLSNIETGKTGFSLAVLASLRDELHVTTDWLLFGPPTEKDGAIAMFERELGAMLEGCTEEQVLAILGFIRSVKGMLQQFGTGGTGADRKG